MSGPEDETYSTVFASLKHPIRRKVLRTLSAGPQSFSGMQRTFGIESSHLTYHLEGLGNLLLKTGDGKYALSSLGEAAMSMMNQVEGPPAHRLYFSFPSKKWKYLVAALVVGVILLSASFFFEYQSLSQLSTQYSSLRMEHELLEEAWRQGLNLGNASLTYKFETNGTVKPALVTYHGNSTTIIWGHSFDAYSIYNMVNESTLEVKISFPGTGQQERGFAVMIYVPHISTDNMTTIVLSNNTQWSSASQAAVSYELVWGSWNVTKNAEYSVTLLSRGQYEISVGALSVENITDVHEINYAMTLQLKVQGSNAPFFFLGSGVGIGGVPYW